MSTYGGNYQSVSFTRAASYVAPATALRFGGEAVVDAVAPTFAGVVALNTATAESLTARWNAGTDDVTAQADLAYDLCWATTAAGCTGANFTVMASSPPGATSLVIGGLDSGTTYYVCVRARDEAGNRDANNVTASGTTLALDTTAPTVANFSPTPGAPLYASSEVAFDVTDAGGLRRVLVIAYLGSVAEVVHDGDAFQGAYVASRRTGIAGGFHFAVARRGGWPVSPTLKVFAIDVAGNEAS